MDRGKGKRVDYQGLWKNFEDDGYKIGPFSGGHTELLAPDGRRIEVYNFSGAGLPEEVKYKMLVEKVHNWIQKHG